jgi:RHS repeat-associated protein
VAVRYRFDPWGVPVEQTKPHLNPIGFTGYLRDPATDQLYAQARQYQPGVGRFTSVDPWTGDPLSPISLNQYLYGYGNPGVYFDPDGRCGILSSLPNLSGVCGFVESRLLGIDLGTVEGQMQLAEYRAGTRQGAIRTVVETAVGAAQLFADISVAGRERLTGENFGASDRVGAVVSGMADTASDLPGAVATYAADREEAIRTAHASGNFREVGDNVGRMQLEVGSAVTGTVGTTRAAVGMAARLTPSPSRPLVLSESPSVAGPRFDVDAEAGLGQIEHPVATKVMPGPANVRGRTGHAGQVESVFAKIEPHNVGRGSATNASSRSLARRLGNQTDDAGHALGQNLGGQGGARSGNIFPQSPSVNRGAFNQFEQQIARRVAAGDEVFVRVVPRYAAGSTRPHEITYQVRINGKTITRTFANP